VQWTQANANNTSQRKLHSQRQASGKLTARLGVSRAGPASTALTAAIVERTIPFAPPPTAVGHLNAAAQPAAQTLRFASTLVEPAGTTSKIGASPPETGTSFPATGVSFPDSGNDPRSEGTHVSDKPEATSFKPSAPWQVARTTHAARQLQRNTDPPVEAVAIYSKSS
jgi:hypothetical protein